MSASDGSVTKTCEIRWRFQGRVFGFRHARGGFALPNLWLDTDEREFKALDLEYLIQMARYGLRDRRVASVFLGRSEAFQDVVELRCSIDGLKRFQDKPLASGRHTLGINTRPAEEVAYLRLRAVWPRRGVSAAGTFASPQITSAMLERAVVKSLHEVGLEQHENARAVEELEAYRGIGGAHDPVRLVIEQPTALAKRDGEHLQYRSRASGSGCAPPPPAGARREKAPWRGLRKPGCRRRDPPRAGQRPRRHPGARASRRISGGRRPGPRTRSGRHRR